MEPPSEGQLLDFGPVLLSNDQGAGEDFLPPETDGLEFSELSGLESSWASVFDPSLAQDRDGNWFDLDSLIKDLEPEPSRDFSDLDLFPENSTAPSQQVLFNS